METPVRLLTWNVLGLREVARVAAVVRAARADVVCLQECPRWPGGRAALALVARSVGLRLAAGGGSRGVAVLVAPHVGVERSRVSAMPRPFTGWWWAYPRASALARVRVGGWTIDVASAHLDVSEEGRLAHAERLLADLSLDGLSDGDATRLRLVAGDLNETPDGPTWRLLASHLQDAGAGSGGPTYPVSATRRPTKRIDAVLVDPRIAVVDVRTGTDRPGLPSDHLPVLVTLVLPDPAGR
ncbi:endonuclease/exonuclease/phosphatase family protein [Serinibacter arcticus]|uniref:endonuclease/exonuclease/phosphatase family protein n=1 Tax=Serinibacter arcticus TaxID=1655435 RepID=UPI001304F639|nr:endonuclease/exonuclease/phosphatase family protein [Serinibacter arcticus]